jgi:hypothetical protein
MLIAAFIFVLSVAALIQFVGLQWRAGIVRVASTSLAMENEVESQLAGNLLKNKSFSDVAAFQKLCPDLGTNPKLQSVRVYHGFLQLFAGIGSPDWVKREMDLCARYAVAVLMQQVKRNHEFAAQASSF